MSTSGPPSATVSEPGTVTVTVVPPPGPYGGPDDDPEPVSVDVWSGATPGSDLPFLAYARARKMSSEAREYVTMSTGSARIASL